MRSSLDVRDDLRELAERYETVASLDVAPADAGRAGPNVPGSRLPPGLQELLDAEEMLEVLRAVTEWAQFLAHVVADECGVTMPDQAPARLRAVGDHAGYLMGHDDELFALSVLDDLAEHLRAMRRLTGRGARKVRTGMHCQSPVCGGTLVSVLGADADGSLRCDKCGEVIPHSVWSSWPRARVTYVTVEHAARIVGTTVGAVRVRASRGNWRRRGSGRETRYHIDDVRAAS